MRVAIVALSVLPVPAVKGGAVETLIEYIIKQNEIYNKLDLTVYSIYDKKAVDEAKQYKNTKFKFIKVNKNLNKIYRLYTIVMRKFFKIINHSIYDKKVVKHIKGQGYDKVIFEGYTEAILLASKYIDKSKVYMHIHHEAFKNLDDVKKKVFLNSNKIITVSEYIKKQTIKEIGSLDEDVLNKKLVVLKNCTDTITFNKDLYKNERDIIRKKYNFEEKDIVIMFTGRIVPEKGIKELILAFKRIVDNNVKLLIVGNAGFGNEIKSKYDEELLNISTDIKDKIIFTGFIHNSELPKLHAAVDIAVVPSIWDDPAPLVVFEAMASGLPLVVTDSGGVPEYINDECAFTIKRNEKLIENLSNALESLIKSQSLREKMGQAGRINALKYTTKQFYNDYVQIVKE